MPAFGIKSIHLTTTKAQDRYCSSCDSYDAIVLNVFRKQVHFFGIPIFPVEKTGNAFCKNCKTILQEDEIPELLKHHYLTAKNNTQGSTWQIPGSIALLVISITFSLMHRKTNQQELDYLATPKRGDIYTYKLNDVAYSIMKIRKVSTDSIYVVLNKHNIETPKNLNKINIAEKYDVRKVAYERQKVYDMYNKGIIIEIKRIGKYQ